MKKTTTKSKSIKKNSTTKKTTKKVAPKKSVKKVEKKSIKNVDTKPIKKVEPVKEITKKEVQLIPKKITIYLLIIGILLALSIILGYTYSIYQIDKIQPVANEITVGCFTINFEDSGTSNSYTNFSLTNSYPIEDEDALALTPYKFKITNVCNYMAKTDIAINVLKTSSISQLATNQGKVIGDMVKVAIQEGTKAVSVPSKLSSFNERTIRSGDTVTDKSYIIRTDYMDAEESRTYNVWMWVPEEINSTEVENEAQGLTLYAKVDILSTAVDEVIPEPELYQGMLPVRYDENGNTVVAGKNNWYDYDKHEWANAVLVTSSARSKTAGQTLSDNEILQYYVWIPRYRYKLFNAVAGESSDEQMIEIEFENKTMTKSNGTSNGEWLTHPAFTFGNTELNGFWVGKFEVSSSDSQYLNVSTNKFVCNDEFCDKSSSIIIKPNLLSLIANKLSYTFYASRSIENSSIFGLDPYQIDTHMMKNMEWGAVAYLSSSKYGLYKNSDTCYNSDNNITVTINDENANRCEIWTNTVHTGTGVETDTGKLRYGHPITGCSANDSIRGNVQDNMSDCGGSEYEWNGSINNGRSSTTGNVYGIYDMVGGGNEPVMGAQSTSSSEFIWDPNASGFISAPDDKYYDKYLATIYETGGSDMARGLLGDATREVMKNYGSTGSGAWYGSYSNFVALGNLFVRRGCYASGVNQCSIFSIYRNTGGAQYYNTFRVVMTAEDD